MTWLWIGAAVLLGGVILAGIAAMIARYRKEIRFYRERVESLGSQVTGTACGPVEYLRSGEGYPLLVVHGAMGGFDQGMWLAHGFDLTQYQLICPSRFGYLRSPVPEKANLDMQADAFACLLDALKIETAAIFAASSGATSAIRFAARYPERVSALILLSPDSPGEVMMPMPPKFVFNILFGSDFIHWALVTYFPKFTRTVTELAPRNYPLTPEYESMLKKIQLGDLPVARRFAGMVFETFTVLDEFMASVTPESPYPLSKIDTPVLVINAADDRISLPANVRRLAGLMPNARLYFAPDGGHLLFGHTEEVKAEIAAFLRSHTSEKSPNRTTQ